MKSALRCKKCADMNMEVGGAHESDGVLGCDKYACVSFEVRVHLEM